jgi:hypothetical protein
MTTQTYIGKGPIYLGPRDGSGPQIHVGNSTVLNLTPAEEEKSLIDGDSPGGGKYASLKRVTGVALNLTVHEWIPQNLAIATRGAASTVSGGAISDEVHNNVQVDGLVRFVKVPDPDLSVTVTDNPSTTTYTEGTDYKRVAAGIVILSGGAIADDDDLLIDYTALASNVVQALVNSGLEYKATFSGLNEAESDRPVIVDVHRLRFGPAQLDLKGDDYGAIQLTGDVLKDTGITGSGLSQYYRIEYIG